MKLAARLLFVTVAWVIFAPGVASAQSAIAGIVKDTTGSIMPGVTVEAASPALIERVRSAITDAQGQYKIVDLRPGTYRAARSRVIRGRATTALARRTSTTCSRPTSCRRRC